MVVLKVGISTLSLSHLINFNARDIMYRLNFRFLQIYYPLLLKGIINTLIIVVFSSIIGFILGLLMAIMRRSKHKSLRIISTFWVDFLRNTPFLVQLFFLFYGLPELGINTNPLVTSIIALGINTSAPNCEVIRAGLMAVKNSYYECSAALGFTPFQTMYYIIIPISLRLAFRPLTSNFINLVLTSSVAFSVTVTETMGAAKTMAARTSRPFEIYLIIMLIYCIFTFTLSFLAKYIGKKISITL